MLGLDYRQNYRSSQNTLKKYDNFNKSKLKYQKQSNSMNKTAAQDFEKLLKMQIKNANDLITKAKLDIQQSANNQQKKQIVQLRDIEQSIRRSNNTIKQIESQINYLKNHHKKVNINPEDAKMNLTQEIRSGLNEIVKLRRKMQEKRNLLSQKWQQVRVAQEQFAIKCKKDNKQIIDFQVFRQIQQKRRRQLIKNQKSLEASKKKQVSSIWQSSRQKGGFSSNNLKINPQNKTIRDFMIRKNVAENALKNEKKKHKQQMFNLASKLQFLKDEESQIEMKIKSKSHELHNAQKKFSESRNSLQVEQSLKKYKIQKLKTVD